MQNTVSQAQSVIRGEAKSDMSSRPWTVATDGITKDVALIYGGTQFDLTLALSKALQERGLSTQWDQGRREGTVTEILENVIKPIIHTSRCVVAMISAQSTLSHFFVAELTIANDYNKPIIFWKPNRERAADGAESDAMLQPEYVQLADRIATGYFGMQPETLEEKKNAVLTKIEAVSRVLAGANNIATFFQQPDDLGSVVDYLEWFVAELRRMQQSQMPITGANSRVAIAGKEAPGANSRPASGSREMIASANNIGNQGYRLQALGQLAEAWALHTQALCLHRQKGSQIGEAIDLGNFGAIESHRGSYESALSYFTQSLDMHRSIGNMEGMADQLNNVAAVERMKGNLEAALRKHMEALEIYRRLGIPRGEASQHANMGNVYQMMKRSDEAVVHHKLALNMYRKLKSLEGQAKCLANLGMIAEENRHMEDALAYFDEGLDLARRASSRHDEVNILLSIGRVLKAQGKNSEAKEFLSKSLILAQEFGYYDLEEAATMILGEIAEPGNQLAARNSKQSGEKAGHADWLARAEDWKFPLWKALWGSLRRRND